MDNQVDAARQKLIQLFNYFKAVEQRRAPIVRHIANQPWVLWINTLPTFDTISQFAPAQGDGTWLLFRKPETHPCPEPGEHLKPWLGHDWDNPETTTASHSLERVIIANGEPTRILFSSQNGLEEEFRNWQARRDLWKNIEYPARAALRIWERLFALHSQLEREGEAWELIIGDGIFNWKRPSGDLHHPILLQRVEISFESRTREFRICNVDSPPELNSSIFADDECAGLPIKKWQDELNQGELHPLGGEGVTDWLKSVVGAFKDGEYISAVPQSVELFPRIGRSPVLFLRKRQAGRIKFIEEILSDLPTATELPKSLLDIVGCTSDAQSNQLECESDTAYANEDHEILLSKPANAAQLSILKRLNRQDGVLVQGPPGTGKTHTIANLIGSLLAEGKSILVTSHTTKALRVLRAQVSIPLQSLCVSVLDSDATSRKEREMAVRELASRLGESRQSFIQQASVLTEKRREVLSNLRSARADLAMAINGEYKSIILAGEEVEPWKAAREIADGIGQHDWIPGIVATGKPLSLTESELITLYASNDVISVADEVELSNSLPNVNDLWSPDKFQSYTNEYSDLLATNISYRNDLWVEGKQDHGELSLLLEQVSCAIEDIVRSEVDVWKLAVIQAGMEGGHAAEIWKILCREIEAVHNQASLTAESVFRYAPRLADDYSLEVQRDVLQQIIQHLNKGKAISLIALLLNSRWKSLIECWLVNEHKPERLEHFQSLLNLVELELARGLLVGYWTRQMQPHGAPDLKQITDIKPEEYAFQFVSQILAALDWHAQIWTPLENGLVAQGLHWLALLNDAPPAQTPHHRAERLRHVVHKILPEVMASETRRRRLAYLKARFSNLKTELSRIDRVANSAFEVVRSLKRAAESKAVGSYRTAYLRLEHLHQLLPAYKERNAYLGKLRSTAPDWANCIERRLPPHNASIIPGAVSIAWRWRQFAQELDRRATLSVPEIQERIEHLGDELRDVTVNLVAQRAWAALLGKVKDSQRQALLGWIATMKKIGAGTGRTVPALLRQARQEMALACGAVPVWIMPFNQVTSSFHPVRDRFDVIIVDEASQEGILGLIPFYMAKKVIVVGDDEQVTPLDVGGEQQPIQDLISQWLEGLPSKLLFDLKTSIYDRAQIAFGAAIRLKEHFRCVPEIIQFSNHLSYKGEIRPLRESDSTAIKPPLVAHRVDGVKIGKKNPIEAETVASLVIAAIEQPEYAGKTFGIISLVGEEQSDEIDKILRVKLDPVAYETRRILCGNPSQFQGDERDVIFLSMVDSKEEGDGPLGLRQDGQDGMWKKRYNVAASRAKDQLWVVYSLDYQTQLKHGDLRRRLVEHALAPDALMRLLADPVANTESPFEAEVYRILSVQGYKVRPQWQVGAYRIDLVVEGGGKRLAVECDGERWHYDKVEEDLARQALLERLGWKFVRIRGSVFYRDKSPNREDAMHPVFERLKQMGIAPESVVDDPEINRMQGENQTLECIKRRSTELLNEWKNNAPDSIVEQSLQKMVELDPPAKSVAQPTSPEPIVGAITSDLFGLIPSRLDSPLSIDLEVGQLVDHKKFGKGRIAAFKDNKQQMQIYFERDGSKWLSVKFSMPNLIILPTQH